MQFGAAKNYTKLTINKFLVNLVCFSKYMYTYNDVMKTDLPVFCTHTKSCRVNTNIFRFWGYNNVQYLIEGVSGDRTPVLASAVAQTLALHYNQDTEGLDQITLSAAEVHLRSHICTW